MKLKRNHIRLRPAPTSTTEIKTAGPDDNIRGFVHGDETETTFAKYL